MNGEFGDRQHRERPLAVGRDRHRVALAEAHDGRTVGLAHEDRVVRAAGLAFLVEEEDAGVRGEVGREGVVEEGHVALARVALEHGEHADARALARQQHAAAVGHVVELQAARERASRRGASRQRHGPERAVGAGLGGREPDLVARGGPGQAALARPLAGQRRLLAGEVDRPRRCPRRRAGTGGRETRSDRPSATAARS